MRRFYLIILVVVFLITPLTSFSSGCGDVNGDSTINIFDITYLISNLYLDGLEPQCRVDYGNYCGDVNSDSTVNIFDITYLIAYLYLNGPSPYCPPYYVAWETTTLIPQDSSSAIIGYDSTGTVCLDSSSTYAQDLEIGDVIIGHDGEIVPEGFLRKVISINYSGDSVVLGTEQATLPEAFEELYVSGLHTLKPENIIESKMAEGSRLIPTRGENTFTIEMDQILYDADGNHETSGDQIKIVGTYEFDAEFFFAHDLLAIPCAYLETWTYTEEELSIDIIAEVQWEFGEELAFDIAELKLVPIMFGFIPVTPELKIKAHVGGDLTVTVETGMTCTQDIKKGFRYEDCQFEDISEEDKSFTYSPPQLSTEFDFEAGPSLDVALKIFGICGPYMGGKLGLHFESVLETDPCQTDLIFNLEAILYAVVGIQCEMFGIEFDYHSTFWIYQHDIWDDVFPLSDKGTIVINPEPDALNAFWSLNGPCSFSAFGYGDETLTSLNPGDYTISWEDISGWTTPPGEMKTLTADATLTFNGTYIEEQTNTVTDIDGNVYQTVQIGDQIWMAENLKVTHYRNGDSIPNVTDQNEWAGLYVGVGAYCEYGNNHSNVSTYGRLYNWYVVDDSRGIAPAGWHVPSYDEWQTLVDYLGGAAVAGGKLKEVGTEHWESPNTGATNESGFTALPGGCRDHAGYYNGLGWDTSIWSTTLMYGGAWILILDCSSATAGFDHFGKPDGNSIRCIKD